MDRVAKTGCGQSTVMVLRLTVFVREQWVHEPYFLITPKSTVIDSPFICKSYSIQKG